MFKKIISSILAVAMVAAMSTSVFAEEASNVGSDTGTFTIDLSEPSRAQLTSEQQQNIDDKIEKFFSGEANGLKVGERVEIGELGGDTLYLEVREEQTNTKAARGFNDIASKTFYVVYNDIWGNTKEAISVAMTCYWYNDGLNSYIRQLSGTYTVLNNSYSCNWDTDKGSVIESTYAEMYLKVYHYGVSASFTYAAMCNGVAEPPIVTMFSL